jgi:hypothetical protein
VLIEKNPVIASEARQSPPMKSIAENINLPSISVKNEKCIMAVRAHSHLNKPILFRCWPLVIFFISV